MLDGAKILAARLTQPECRDAGVRVLTGGTDVHLVLVDLVESTLDGKAGRGPSAFDRAHRQPQAMPFDPRPPMVTSGLRIGTSALATPGFGDFTEVADIIARALRPNFDDVDRRDLASRIDLLTSSSA